jgi:hypothetical protein
MYLGNMASILADKAEAGPGSLYYAIPDKLPAVHDLLLQKSDGAFELVLWSEQTSGLAIDKRNVKVYLGKTFATLRVYDPTKGTSPILDFNSVPMVSLFLPDHPLIVEIQD